MTEGNMSDMMAKLAAAEAEAVKLRSELKESARLGPAAEDNKEGRVLNRIVQWLENGLGHEGDPSQVETCSRTGSRGS